MIWLARRTMALSFSSSPPPIPDSSAASVWASVTSSPRMSETFSSNLRPAVPSPPPVADVPHEAPGGPGAAPGRRVQELGDVPSQADRKSDIEAGEGAFNVGDAIKGAGIVRQDPDGRSGALEGRPRL